uniref:Uncharacterized protein n=1 Tax=Vitis vinifera TaxID=29760 RepID=A5APG0_VITVI|nr:hypothetical protein VITISV_019967 [Vitis vinifera]
MIGVQCKKMINEHIPKHQDLRLNLRGQDGFKWIWVDFKISLAEAIILSGGTQPSERLRRDGVLPCKVVITSTHALPRHPRGFPMVKPLKLSTLNGQLECTVVCEKPDRVRGSGYLSGRAKVVGMIDRPKEQDQIDMVLWNLQPRTSRVWFRQLSVLRRPSLEDYGRMLLLPLTEPYIAQTSMQPRPPHPRAATHPPPRPYAQRPARQFTPLGMTLTKAFEKLRDGGLIVPLAPRPLPHPIPPHFRSHEHCLYHQIQGHDTERCWHSIMRYRT